MTWDGSSPRASSIRSPRFPDVNHSVSNFTPVLTPNNASRNSRNTGSMILLSPSKSVTDAIRGLVTTTAEALEGIWDEIGYGPEERASQLSDLIAKFRDLCEQKISEERHVMETFQQTIQESKEEIKTTSEALRIPTDHHLLREHSGQTLTDELATLEAALEGLRASATAAKEDLRECSNFIVEAHQVLGLSMDNKWKDIESDLTSTRREEFHTKRAEMKEELSTRSTAIIQLVRDCQNLQNDLRIDPERSENPFDRQIAGSLVRSKDDSFIMTSKFETETCTGISAKAMEKLTKRVAELHAEKKNRRLKIQDMGTEISMLWEKLRVPMEEQRAFTESIQGLGLDTITKGENELARLRQLKSRKLGSLIAESRNTIQELWNQTSATPEFRKQFTAFFVTEDGFDEELLERHDDYITDLIVRLEEMKPILRMIEKRELIVQERYELEELQKDPERLKQRGASRQLMEEEKMARRVKRELPKLNEHLTEKLLEWPKKHGEEFKYNGELYLETIGRQEEEWRQHKEDQMERKKKKKEGQTLGTGYPGMKKKSIPLGDAGRSLNARTARARSHEDGKAAHLPQRHIGSKQPSSRF